MKEKSAAVLILLEEIESCLWALRFHCRDSALFAEIKDTIKDAPRRDRRWDPDLCVGKGAWVVDESILDDLEKYFPSMHRKRFPDEEQKEEEDPYSCPF